MEAIFLGIHLVIGIALIAIVLIQRSSSDGMGLGSGSGTNFMSGRQTANLLTRTTAVLATLFILNSLWLGILATNKSSESLVDQVEAVGKQKDTKPEKDEGTKKDTTNEKDGKSLKNKEEMPSENTTGAAKESDKKAEPESVPAVPVAE